MKTLTNAAVTAYSTYSAIFPCSSDYILNTIHTAMDFLNFVEIKKMDSSFLNVWTSILKLT